MASEHTIEELAEENALLRSEIEDLRTMLDAVTGHSDGMEADLMEKVLAGEKLFQVLSKTIPVPFLIVEKAGGTIHFSNENAQRLFGHTAEELNRKKAVDLYVTREDRKTFLKMLRDLKWVENFEVRFSKSDGSEFWACVFSQPIFFKEQECHLTVIYDLTERKNAEEEKLALEKQLRQTQKMEALGTLSGGIAHDFNNILGIIFGNIELAMMILPEETKVKKYLNNAMTAANRAKAMIMQILAFCRQKEQERKPFQIGMIVTEASKMMSALLTSDVRIKANIQTKTSIVIGDPTQIHQVVMNLCANAKQALQNKGGVIEVALTEVHLGTDDRMMLPKLEPGSYVKLTVSDNGPGMEKGIIDRVFDPFFTTKPIGEGTGMGLAVVHGIVVNHGGAVSVESEPGKGAAFHCYFPMAAETEKARDSIIRQNPLLGGTESILVVDDEEGILDIYTQMLFTLGYRVEATASPVEALRLVKTHAGAFDLVITDHTMPDMSGLALAEEIHKIDPDLPIILCSGSADLSEEKDLDKIGIRAFLAKPFTHHQITGLIRKIMRET